MNIFGKISCIALMIFLLLGFVDSSHAEEEDCDDIDYMCAFFDEEDEEGGDKNVQDPWENVNRTVYVFNDHVYVYVLDPVARGYATVVPEDIRGCVASFFYNLNEPIRVVNAILQGRFRDSGTLTERFFINSTLGVFGLADVAHTEFDIKPIEASLSGTLGSWGVGDGYYIMVPILGPSTMRDFTGTLVDFIGPSPYGYLTNYEYINDRPSKFQVSTTKTVNSLSLHLGEYEDLKSFTLDPYTALKNAYFQYRKKE